MWHILPMFSSTQHGGASIMAAGGVPLWALHNRPLMSRQQNLVQSESSQHTLYRAPSRLWIYIAGAYDCTTQRDETPSSCDGPSGEAGMGGSVVIHTKLFFRGSTLCLLSHRVSDEQPASPPPPRTPPVTSLPPLPDGPTLPPYIIYIFIYFTPALRVTILISSVKHDYYLLMPKLRGHSFCHPPRCIFPA